MTSQCLSEHTVPISARFHHLVPSLADLSPLAIMSMNSYIWPIGISFQDQELSPHLKVLKQRSNLGFSSRKGEDNSFPHLSDILMPRYSTVLSAAH